MTQCIGLQYVSVVQNDCHAPPFLSQHLVLHFYKLKKRLTNGQVMTKSLVPITLNGSLNPLKTCSFAIPSQSVSAFFVLLRISV